MSYIDPINRIPLAFEFGKKINYRDVLPLITFYDIKNEIVAKCHFSDEKSCFENKGNLFYLVQALDINRTLSIPIPKMLRFQKIDNDYLLTFYDNDTCENIGKYLFAEQKKGAGRVVYIKKQPSS